MAARVFGSIFSATDGGADLISQTNLTNNRQVFTSIHALSGTTSDEISRTNLVFTHPIRGAEVITSTTVVVTNSNKYKLRGWDSTLNIFEVWVGSTPYDRPPSGKVLLDISWVLFEN